MTKLTDDMWLDAKLRADNNERTFDANKLTFDASGGTAPRADDPLDILVALQQLQRVVTDHHVAILKLQSAVACFPCPEGRTATDAAAPSTTPLAAPSQTLDVGECVEYGLCNCAAGPATTPLKLGQADPVP